MQHRNRQHIFLDPFEKASKTRRRHNQLMTCSAQNVCKLGLPCRVLKSVHSAATELDWIRCHLSLNERSKIVERSVNKRGNVEEFPKILRGYVDPTHLQSFL